MSFESFVLQPRDLIESRVMTAAYIAALHFAGSKEPAQGSLKKERLHLRDGNTPPQPPCRLLPQGGSRTPVGAGVLSDRDVTFSVPALRQLYGRVVQRIGR